MTPDLIATVVDPKNVIDPAEVLETLPDGKKVIQVTRVLVGDIAAGDINRYSRKLVDRGVVIKRLEVKPLPGE